MKLRPSLETHIKMYRPRHIAQKIRFQLQSKKKKQKKKENWKK